MVEYRHLKHKVPKGIFKPNPYYLLPLLLTLVSGAGGVVLLASFEMAWYFKLLVALFIGYNWCIGGLFGHDLLHGSIVRSKKWQDILGFFCLLPFLISPTFWRYWHNNLHHSFTQKVIKDPDAYPTLRVFKQSRFTQWMFPFSPGSGHKRSFFYLFFWFSVNVQVAQHYFRYRNKVFNKLNHRRVNIELLLAFLIHVFALIAVGPALWMWAVIIPFFIMNYLPFSYISTNHNLSPLTKKNDPLENSLTVTNNPILEFFHLNFGYHVEHHLFPTVSGFHLKKLHFVLKDTYPDRYQYMPKWRALRELYRTARIYKNSTTLVHPKTGKTYPVVQPKDL
jgi:fatty acid desaturase